MVSFGGVGSIVGKFAMSWIFWLLFVIILGFVIIGSLYMRKKGKFHFPAVIFSDNGNGKVGLRFTRAGWFKSKKLLGGLLDVSGERRLETKDGRIVQQGSSADFHEIDFKTALMLQEKPDDPKVLVPISKFMLTPNSSKVLMDIAPSDYRDACSKIIQDSEKESLSKWETLAQVMVFGVLGIILFISIILTIQYVKNTMADANAIHKEAMGFYDKVLSRTSAIPSGTSTAP
jgi:hypothetical protein